MNRQEFSKGSRFPLHLSGISVHNVIQQLTVKEISNYGMIRLTDSAEQLVKPGALSIMSPLCICQQGQFKV